MRRSRRLGREVLERVPFARKRLAASVCPVVLGLGRRPFKSPSPPPLVSAGWPSFHMPVARCPPPGPLSSYHAPPMFHANSTARAATGEGGRQRRVRKVAGARRWSHPAVTGSCHYGPPVDPVVAPTHSWASGSHADSSRTLALAVCLQSWVRDAPRSAGLSPHLFVCVCFVCRAPVPWLILTASPLGDASPTFVATPCMPVSTRACSMLGDRGRAAHALVVGIALAVAVGLPPTAMAQVSDSASVSPSPSPSPCPLSYTTAGTNDTFEDETTGEWLGASASYCGTGVFGGFFDLGTCNGWAAGLRLRSSQHLVAARPAPMTAWNCCGCVRACVCACVCVLGSDCRVRLERFPTGHRFAGAHHPAHRPQRHHHRQLGGGGNRSYSSRPLLPKPFFSPRCLHARGCPGLAGVAG
jgi:hypothetical protein